MYFIIDGYNLLFTCSTDMRSLEVQRGNLLQWMQQQFARLDLTGMIVFDGGHQMPNECEISYQNPLEIAYTPKGQSADAYIIDYLSTLKGAKITTVVTNDKGLLCQCRPYTSKSMSTESFIRWLLKKSKKKKSSNRQVPKESSYQIDRMTKIFEDLLNEDL